MACIVILGGKVLAAEPNSHAYGRHAEVRALRPHGNYVGGTLYVMRSNSKFSKPCENCWKALDKAGINTVVYFDDQNRPKKERVKKVNP
jgi:pyrimidine deaminase RibD-like protein